MPGLETIGQVGISSLVLSRKEISPKLGPLHNTVIAMPGLGTVGQVGISSLVLPRKEISPKLGSLHNTLTTTSGLGTVGLVGLGNTQPVLMFLNNFLTDNLYFGHY